MQKSQLVRGRFYVVKLEGTKDVSWGTDTVVQLIESDKTGIQLQRKDGISLVLKTARFITREVPGFDALEDEARQSARLAEEIKKHNETRPLPERVQKGGQHTLATTEKDLDNYTPTPKEDTVKKSAFPLPKTRNTAPHLIVVARAGTGKTTTLVEGLKVVLLDSISSHITPSPQQQAVWDSLALSRGVNPGAICFVAFNKSIADELKRRVPPGVGASTMHGLGFASVRQAYGNVRVDEKRVENLTSLVLERDPREIRANDPEFLPAVERLVGLCKMNLIGLDLDTSDPSWATELETLASYYEIELAGNRSRIFDVVPKVLSLCKMVHEDRCIDFSDMIWVPVANDLAVRRYDLLLVDEAQDLNRCQQALAKKAGERLVLCGDPAQAIYGFAGADAESMSRMQEELGATARGVQVLPLTVTRRCGKKIVVEAKKIVSDFDAFETNPEGTINRMTLAPGATSYRNTASDGDMVLCRVNAPLVSECFAFLKSGRKANIQGRDVGRGLISTINKLNAKDVPHLVSKLSDWVYAEQRKEAAKRNPSEARMIAIQDRYECILVFTEGKQAVKEVVSAIESVFTDNPDAPGIRLSSIHKAKGLEARRVFLLEPKGATVPHPMAKGPWQTEQEFNLRYVAITRAIEELVYVS